MVYCARGQAENLIKAHKLHLASDRTSCRKATANQFRLLIHTAAYWLMLSLRGLAPRNSFWREAQFDTIRLRLIKVAGRVTEMVTRIKLALPSALSAAEPLHRLGRPRPAAKEFRTPAASATVRSCRRSCFMRCGATSCASSRSGTSGTPPKVCRILSVLTPLRTSRAKSEKRATLPDFSNSWRMVNCQPHC